MYDPNRPHGMIDPYALGQQPGVLQRAAAMILRSVALEGSSPRPDFSASAICSLVAMFVSELDRLDDSITEKGADRAIEYLNEAIAKVTEGKSDETRDGAKACADFMATMLRMSAKSNKRATQNAGACYVPGDAGPPIGYGAAMGYPVPPGGFQNYPAGPASTDPLDDPYLAPEVKFARTIAKHGADPAAWPEKARAMANELSDAVKADRDARAIEPMHLVMEAIFSHGADRSKWPAEAQKAADDLAANFPRPIAPAGPPETN